MIVYGHNATTPDLDSIMNFSKLGRVLGAVCTARRKNLIFFNHGKLFIDFSRRWNFCLKSEFRVAEIFAAHWRIGKAYFSGPKPGMLWINILGCDEQQIPDIFPRTEHHFGLRIQEEKFSMEADFYEILPIFENVGRSTTMEKLRLQASVETSRSNCHPNSIERVFNKLRFCSHWKFFIFTFHAQKTLTSSKLHMPVVNEDLMKQFECNLTSISSFK